MTCVRWNLLLPMTAALVMSGCGEKESGGAGGDDGSTTDSGVGPGDDGGTDGGDEGSGDGGMPGDDGSTEVVDEDGDGFSVADGDCDDADPTVYPGAEDSAADGSDQDCDGLDGPDADGDGAVDANAMGDDCDDTDPTLNPHDEDSDGVSSCDGDCNDDDDATFPGSAPNDSPTACMTDADGDGYGSMAPAAAAEPGTDCDDTLASVHPGASDAGWTDANCDGEHSVDPAATGVVYTTVRNTNSGNPTGMKQSISLTDDLDGDGRAEVLMSANGDSTLAHEGGAAALFLSSMAGSAMSFDYTDADAIWTGEEDSQAVGAATTSGALATIGDVDGGGVSDLVMGAHRSDVDGYYLSGRVFLVYGETLAAGAFTVEDADLSISAERSREHLGCALAGAGDVDDDGLADLVLGAWGAEQGGSNAGAVYLFLGETLSDATDLGQSDADAVVIGETAGDYAGNAMVGDVDFDGDGFADVILGVHGWATYNGSVYWVPGDSLLSTATLDFSDVDYRMNGAHYDWAGSSLADVGDYDGDGLNDILIGAPGVGSSDHGAAYLVLSSSVSTLATGSDRALTNADVVLLGSAGGEAGTSVTGAGDVDGDGFSDLAVGAPSTSDGGRVSVVLAAEAGTSGTWNLGDGRYQFVASAPGASFGMEVSGGRDTDGDGEPDLLILASKMNDGEVYLVSSSTP